MPYSMTPDEVRAKYGRLSERRFFTMVDEKAGRAMVLEDCCARGPAEWDLMNIKRAGGVVEDVKLRGTTLFMDAVLGERDINFGPVSADIGGKGIKAIRIEGDAVRTTWYGIAGASVGIGAVLPQSPDVIRTEYPDGFEMGGGHRAHVDIITPKLVRVVVGVDDTDTKEEGATWATVLRMGENAPVGHLLDHRIVQLNPKSPNKTTNCCASAASFAVREEDVPELIEYCYDFVKGESYSEDAVMAVFQGLKIPDELRRFGCSAKTVLLKLDDARGAAADNGVQIISVTGEGGTIGAVAAIGCFDLGPEAAGVPEDCR